MTLKRAKEILGHPKNLALECKKQLVFAHRSGNTERAALLSQVREAVKAHHACACGCGLAVQKGRLRTRMCEVRRRYYPNAIAK
jgi:hypothetical protein